MATGRDRGLRHIAGLRKKRTFNLDKDATIWVALVIFVATCFLIGGSNLPSAAGLVILRPLAICLITLCILIKPAADRALRVPTLLMVGLTLSIAMQLVPLPPGLSHGLPGRPDTTALSQLGIDDSIWRPISVSPSFTWSSFLATLTGWAVIVAMGRLPRTFDRSLVSVIIVGAFASCFVGLLQVAGGQDSVFYFYGTDGTISGLLANRNHQAAMLAMALPLLRIWAVGGDPRSRVRRNAVAILSGSAMLGMLFLTGSRSGLMCGLVGLLAAYTIVPKSRRESGHLWEKRIILRFLVLALPAVMLLLLILAGRDLSLQRIFNSDYASEIRLRSFPTTLSLVKTYFPFGSGYGTFDTVFRMREPDTTLNPTFFNRAHNDYLELAITGGLFPILLLGTAILWTIAKGLNVFFRPRCCGWGLLPARGATVMLVILGLASLSDYPIRPPLMSAIAMIAICLLARAEPPSAVTVAGPS